jgi:tetratricopeptide (TPR) repeat protein
VHSLLCLLLLFPLFLLAAEPLLAGQGREKVFASRAEAAFDVAQIRFQSHPNDPVAAWEFGRASFDWADWATTKSQRGAIARDGIAACRHSLTLTNCAAAHYYLAMNLGQLARSELLGALKLVHEMEREFQTAADLDAKFDFAGPERSLGLLYRDAPARPMSIGNRQKAREFLESAAAIAPAYPENLLNLAESYLTWDDRAKAGKNLAALDALWPQAQKTLSGQAWEDSWDDWSKRRDALRQSLKRP